MGNSLADPITSNTSFVHRLVNQTTFLIIEDDDYDEQPHIYIKIYLSHIVVTDTGCNAPRCKRKTIASLRTYLETQPLSLHNNQPLNPNGAKDYIIICSHCHYDHILGLQQFLTACPTIIASCFDKSFILTDLPTHSLCRYINAPTPKYVVSHWANHMEYLSLSDIPFRIQFLHIPGHTPDSLAWYDLDEHHLYVGDTFYERIRAIPIPELPGGVGVGQVATPPMQGAIIFPEEGNWVAFVSSLELLLSFVRHRNHELGNREDVDDNLIPRVNVACGHLTYAADAEHMIIAVKRLFQRIISGQVPITSSTEKRGAIHDFWLENEASEFSVQAPRRLATEARKHFHPTQ